VQVIARDGKKGTNMRKRKRMGVLAIGLLGVGVATASASYLVPGDAQFINHFTVGGTPKYNAVKPSYLVTVNVVAQLSSPNTGALGGTTLSTVYRDPATNWLTFDYLVTAAATNTRVIVRGALDGPWVDVLISNVGADGSGISGSGDPSPEWTNGNPTYIERDPATQAPTIQWRSGAAQGSIGTVIGPGNSSAQVWFETNAVEFRESVIGYLDSGSIGMAAILVPAGPVPEPATLTFLLLGSLSFLRRNRR